MKSKKLEVEIIDKLIFHKSDPVFEAAKDFLNQVKARIEDNSGKLHLNLPVDKWIKIIPDDKNTPEMQCFKGGEIVIIRFPANSTPYSDKLTTKVKDCTIVHGNIYDENDPSTIYGPGDRFKVYPSQDIRPHTIDGPALAVVKLI